MILGEGVEKRPGRFQIAQGTIPFTTFVKIRLIRKQGYDIFEQMLARHHIYECFLRYVVEQIFVKFQGSYTICLQSGSNRVFQRSESPYE